MIFNSYSFAIFFPVVVLCYFLLRTNRTRNIFLLLSSYFFYMSYDAKLIFLIIGMSLISYIAALAIDKNNAQKKIILIVAVCINLGILFVFKYYNFFAASVVKISRFFTGAKMEFLELNLLIPVGISFYTFEIISYLVSVYQGKISVEKNFVEYALYISFFPQLLSGPIERAEHFLPQLKRKHQFTIENLEKGFSLFLWGLFKKIVIADRLGIFVDEVYNNLHNYSGIVIGFASLAFTIQIYCDFSGYSEMAVGCAKILDFNLIENFDAPYFSASVKEFWRRWHISLSTWFRDFVYIPMGGNRVSSIRAKFNVLVTFLVSGLWHGANWTFILWGGIHGIFQIMESVLLPSKNKKTFRGGIIARMLLTFLAVSFAWIFFRVNSLDDVIYILEAFGTMSITKAVNEISTMSLEGFNRLYVGGLVISVLLLFFNDFFKKKTGEYWFMKKINEWEFSVYCIVIFAVILLLGVYGPMYGAASFIYFQF